ncbi:carbohydrate ABC transporter permease [Allofournierella sp.]|uniref:carbohydrate ABC transporter permease n=1 Tax=Allofournierella sp. TaxID=1940256 RepID=UPI003AB88DFA
MNSSMVYKNKKPLLLFLTPAFIFMILYLYYPFLRNIYNSFMKIRGLGTGAKGVNEPFYENYVKLFTDSSMRTAVGNTFIMMGVTIVFQVGIALLLALLVDNISKGQQFFRTVYFFPIVISATALGLMFNLVFLYDTGMLNQLRLSLGASELLDFKDEAHALFTLMVPVVWQYIGFYFVIIVTGLNNISGDLYEAAAIDGASGLQRVWYITVPLLHNVLCTCLTLAITGALKVFDLPWVMFPNGMPVETTWLTGTYMYFQTFNAKDVDYASAIAIAIVVLGVVISQLANAIFKEKDY